MIDALATALRELALELHPHEIPLIIGGGYGLILRQQHLDATGEPTLRPYPAGRSTEDLDVFLRAEVIADAAKVETIRDTLDRLQYVPVERAKYYQFVREIEHRGRVSMAEWVVSHWAGEMSHLQG
jgi:hypothetical protein